MEQASVTHANVLTMSREAINQLPLGWYKGPVHLVRSDGDAASAVRRLQEVDVLGFDTETRACFRKGESYPTSLIQFACRDAVYLFQLRYLTGLGGAEAILANPAVRKAGVALSFDVRKLQNLVPFEAGGLVELERLAGRVGIGHNGLRGLAAITLGIRISKGAQRSDWSRADLSPAQVQYAATDAWVCRELYERLSAMPACAPAAAAPPAGADGQPASGVPR